MIFRHESLPQRVLFGAGRAREFLAAEMERAGSRKAMVIASARDERTVASLTSGLDAALVWNDVVQHVPKENAEAARKAAADAGIDVLVSIGGGSTIGLAKAVALTTGLPIVAVPTTYAGSEGTNIWGMTENGVKTTGVNPIVLPVTVIYDPELTLSLPAALSISSGLNALAHCVDSMWAPGANPINGALAVEGIHALARGLPILHRDASDIAARESLLCAAYLSATAFASAGSGMHHKICHVLGGRFNLPHAETHAVVLPHVLGFNAEAAPEAEQRISSALGSQDALEGLNALRASLNAPSALRDYGLAEGNIAEAADLILPIIPSSNPRAVSRVELQMLLHAVWAGEDPLRKEGRR